MPTFYIKASMTTYLETTIEADDENDAWLKANNMDGGDFKAIDDDGGWDIVAVDEIQSGFTK